MQRLVLLSLLAYVIADVSHMNVLCPEGVDGGAYFHCVGTNYTQRWVRCNDVCNSQPTPPPTTCPPPEECPTEPPKRYLDYIQVISNAQFLFVNVEGKQIVQGLISGRHQYAFNLLMRPSNSSLVFAGYDPIRYRRLSRQQSLEALQVLRSEGHYLPGELANED